VDETRTGGSKSCTLKREKPTKRKEGKERKKEIGNKGVKTHGKANFIEKKTRKNKLL